MIIPIPHSPRTSSIPPHPGHLRPFGLLGDPAPEQAPALQAGASHWARRPGPEPLRRRGWFGEAEDGPANPPPAPPLRPRLEPNAAWTSESQAAALRTGEQAIMDAFATPLRGHMAARWEPCLPRGQRAPESFRHGDAGVLRADRVRIMDARAVGARKWSCTFCNPCF